MASKIEAEYQHLAKNCIMVLSFSSMSVKQLRMFLNVLIMIVLTGCQ